MECAMTEEEKRTIATSFIAGLRARDAEMLDAIMAKDVVWSIPGASLTSGEACGVKGIIERANQFADYSVNFEILHVVYGYAGVALLLHNTGKHNGRTLDEHLTTVIQLEANMIKRLDTYISDVKMLNEYFV
jgi:uncharacterized protein